MTAPIMGDKPVPASSPMGMVRELLDKGYNTTAVKVIRVVSDAVTDGTIAKRLDELQAEAQRLEALGQKLDSDNPIYRTLIQDLQPMLKATARKLNNEAETLVSGAIEASGTLTRQMALPNVTDEQLRAVGIGWNKPDPNAIKSAVDVAQGEAWANELARYPDMSTDVVQNQMLKGIISGWNPVRTARLISDTVQNVPVAYANTLMRTLQLSSYRKATAQYQLANADILVYQIRIATLDDRTCLACIALHGTRMPVGAVVADHHNGRCTSIAIVRGRERTVTTGAEWFGSLPEDRQKRIAGTANYEAIKAGAVNLGQFAKRYDDPVFGEMIGQSSLVGLLGDEAKKFYPK